MPLRNLLAQGQAHTMQDIGSGAAGIASWQQHESQLELV